MDKESYLFNEKEFAQSIEYLFISVGKKGYITKGMRFVQLYESLYNLVLGDFDTKLENLDDKIISDNGDMPKVIATVFKIIIDFLTRNPDKTIYIQANTELKQRLYLRIVRNNYGKIASICNVLGVLRNHEAEAFDLTHEYIAFLINLNNS